MLNAGRRHLGVNDLQGKVLNSVNSTFILLCLFFHQFLHDFEDQCIMILFYNDSCRTCVYFSFYSYTRFLSPPVLVE